VIAMFRLFPRNREEWLRAFLFIFQSYPVLVFIARNYYRFVLARGKGAMEALFDFEERIFIGPSFALLCFFTPG
jgi:hypothetical protein